MTPRDGWLDRPRARSACAQHPHDLEHSLDGAAVIELDADVAHRERIPGRRCNDQPKSALRRPRSRSAATRPATGRRRREREPSQGLPCPHRLPPPCTDGHPPCLEPFALPISDLHEVEIFGRTKTAVIPASLIGHLFSWGRNLPTTLRQTQFAFSDFLPDRRARNRRTAAQAAPPSPSSSPPLRFAPYSRATMTGTAARQAELVG